MDKLDTYCTNFVSKLSWHSMHRNKSTLLDRIEDKSDLRKVNASMLVGESRRREVARSNASAPKQMRTYLPIL